MPESLPQNQAFDVSAQNPLSANTREVLKDHGIPGGLIEANASQHTALITEQLDELDMAIALSRWEAPMSPEERPLPGSERASAIMLSKTVELKPQVLKQKQLEERAEAYGQLLPFPEKKFDKDRELVAKYLRSLGPSNQLRQKDGLDAVFELGHIKRLLERDYHALPEASEGREAIRKPELRMTEALVAEELALLWKSTALDPSLPDEEFDERIANPEDRNIFSDEELATMTPRERWIRTGAKLCDEAAEIFDQIYQSPTAPRITRVEALTRGVDMKLRSLQLSQAVESDPAVKAGLGKQFTQLARQHAGLVSDQWTKNLGSINDESGPTEKQQDLLGMLFECNVVAIERLKLIKASRQANFAVRLATPREDTIDRAIKPMTNEQGAKINLSSDVVIETLAGRKLKTLQAKGMKQENYQRRASDSVIYPPELIGMRYLDSAGYEQLLARR